MTASEPMQPVVNVAPTFASADAKARSEFARALAARSHEVQRQRKLAKAQAAMLQQATAIEQPNVASTSAPIDVESPELLRARKQLEALNERLEALIEDKDSEPVNIERLARSVATLREAVRILSGIPLPGNRRPGPERRSRGSAGVAPVD